MKHGTPLSITSSRDETDFLLFNYRYFPIHRQQCKECRRAGDGREKRKRLIVPCEEKGPSPPFAFLCGPLFCMWINLKVVLIILGHSSRAKIWFRCWRTCEYAMEIDINPWEIKSRDGSYLVCVPFGVHCQGFIEMNESHIRKGKYIIYIYEGRGQGNDKSFTVQRWEEVVYCNMRITFGQETSNF